MANVEANIQHLIIIGRKNGAVTKEDVRRLIVKQGGTPSDLVVAFFKLIQEGIQVHDAVQNTIRQEDILTERNVLDRAR